jgi:uncharacterized protein (DUF2141 family)
MIKDFRKTRDFAASVLVASVLGWGASAATAAADSVPGGDLTLHVTGFSHTRGHAIAKLFAAGDNVLGAGRWQVRMPINDKTVALRFEGIPAGRYAAVVFHDENDNGLIDHGVLGPSEPIGFSGGFELGLLSGRPDFERLSFDFKPSMQAVELRVR